METSTPRAGSQLVPTAARHSASYRTEHLRLSSRDKLAEMAATSQGNFEGNFESLDLAELAKKQPWWRKLFGQESGPSAEKYSVATQLLIGGVTGWCTGFIFQKVGRLAATALGGGFFLLQVFAGDSEVQPSWSVRIRSSLSPLEGRQPYRLHQSGLAAGREGREESQGAAEDPQQQPDTYGGQKQSRGGGVVCEEECSSDWWIFRRLSAWYGILKRMTSLPYSWLFQPAAFHSIIG
ncbi:FUN14 domain-containing protein 2 isoform X2 [Kogia breviceps]|uniref:FUN14 domain-containing protein 2 isoform X2 n=1 Tax=Kogia breviceps TaxID=27615 RepID=UPI002795DB6A|nr:FUN14 domain-containing protein 2 isoform X2 [Kogia breviceps]